jgi:hypothetical protein
MIAAPFQMLLHRLLLDAGSCLVHEINPFLCRKMLHFRSPIRLSVFIRSPAEGAFNYTRGIRGVWVRKDIGKLKIS